MNSTLSKTENGSSNGQAARVEYLTPRTNIVETAEGFRVEAEMPGVAKDGLEVTVENGELTFVGRRTVRKSEGQVLHRESRGWDYRRTFTLDSSIDASKITAKLENGVLWLNLAKSDNLKPRKIEVTA